MRHVRRFLLGQGTVVSTAHEQDVLCPQEKTEVSPAIFLEGQLQKVTASPAASTKRAEIEAATQHEVTHAATIAYHIRNAILYNGSIYAGALRHFVAEKSFLPPSTLPAVHLTIAGLASSFIGTKYFGHWLADDCIQYLLAKQYGLPLCLRRPVYSLGHQAKYEDYFNQDWTPLDFARIDNIVIFQDFAQNSLKTRRYRVLRARVRARLISKRSPFVYLRRGNSGVARLIKNENEILKALAKKGFVVVDVSSDSLEDILSHLADAKIVVSVEGSHVAHCCFSVPELSGIILLQPPDMFTVVHKGWADTLSVKFGFVVGDLVDGGYYFSSPDILRTFDLMLTRLETLIH
jgi:hypothetical protein